jgi:hypothetical protein
MEIIYFVALNGLAHVAFVGSRLTTSLFALNLHASDLTVGLLMSLFAALPMLLSIVSGRSCSLTWKPCISPARCAALRSCWCTSA